MERLVGLKDALATLYRHNIKVKIKSKYGDITLKTASKFGFEAVSYTHLYDSGYGIGRQGGQGYVGA